jgi:hypothetical protein
MFYQFTQNNSGGSFLVNEKVGHYVIIEADSADQANELAQKKPVYILTAVPKP